MSADHTMPAAEAVEVRVGVGLGLEGPVEGVLVGVKVLAGVNVTVGVFVRVLVGPPGVFVGGTT